MSEHPPTDEAGFRETFLMRFRTEDQGCLRHLAGMVDELTELAHHWVQPDAAPTTQLYEAALADLGYTRQLLGHLASEPERTQLDTGEIELCRRAGRLAGGLGRLLDEAMRAPCGDDDV